MGKVQEERVVGRRKKMGLLKENDPQFVKRDDALEKADLNKGKG